MEDGKESPKNTHVENGVKMLGENFCLVQGYDLQRKQGTQESQTEDEDMRQQQRKRAEWTQTTVGVP